MSRLLLQLKQLGRSTVLQATAMECDWHRGRRLVVTAIACLREPSTMPRFTISAVIVPLLATFALTACGKHDAGAPNQTSAAQVVANVLSGSAHPLPGRWETTVKIEHIDMPGMTPQMRDAIQRGMTSRQAMATCLTPEQAAHPGSDFFSGGNHSCKYDSFTMAGGKLDAVMSCSGKMMQMKLTMSGTYNETSYSVHSSTTTEMPGGKSMSQDMTSTSHRTGDCTGTEINAGRHE
jgi:hypothetical protein